MYSQGSQLGHQWGIHWEPWYFRWWGQELTLQMFLWGSQLFLSYQWV